LLYDSNKNRHEFYVNSKSGIRITTFNVPYHYKALVVK
jgi:hypothetical protein